MSILDTDHIEMFVGDARQAAQVLCASFGFQVLGHGGPETGLSRDQFLPDHQASLIGRKYLLVVG